MDVNRNTQIVINDDLLRKIVYCIEKAIGDDLQQYLRENHPWGYLCDGADNLRHGVSMRLREGCEAIKVWTTGGGQYQYKLKNTCGER